MKVKFIKALVTIVNGQIANGQSIKDLKVLV